MNIRVHWRSLSKEKGIYFFPCMYIHDCVHRTFLKGSQENVQRGHFYSGHGGSENFSFPLSNPLCWLHFWLDFSFCKKLKLETTESQTALQICVLGATSYWYHCEHVVYRAFPTATLCWKLPGYPFFNLAQHLHEVGFISIPIFQIMKLSPGNVD